MAPASTKAEHAPSIRRKSPVSPETRRQPPAEKSIPSLKVVRRRAAAYGIRSAMVGCGLACGAMPSAVIAEGAFPSEIRLGDGAFTLEPKGLLQLDLGTTVGGDQSAGPGAGWNPRRARLGVEGTFLQDFEYTLLWDFGGTPGSRNRFYQGSVSYNGLEPFSFIAGVFEPSFSLQQDQSAQYLLFFERAAVTQVAAGLGVGSSQLSAEVRAHGERWFASTSLTGGQVGPGSGGAGRTAAMRLAGLPVRTEGLTLHTGFSGAWSFRPPRDDDGRRSFSLSEGAELRLDRGDPLLRTGAIPADAARVAGLELGLGWRRLQMQGEVYRIQLDRGSEEGGTLDFSGWYAQASYTLSGRPREYKPADATWGSPGPGDDGFDPSRGRWGAVEVGARVSTIDLNDGKVRGGRQRIWSLGLGWWPVEGTAVFTQLQHVEIAGGKAGNTRYQAATLRVLATF